MDSWPTQRDNPRVRRRAWSRSSAEGNLASSRTLLRTTSQRVRRISAPLCVERGRRLVRREHEESNYLGELRQRSCARSADARLRLRTSSAPSNHAVHNGDVVAETSLPG